MPHTAAALFDDARTRLRDAPREGLGREKVSRWRGTRIIPVGTAWHLGVLLLTDDEVLATAEVVRAAAHVRRGYSAESARARAVRREQARRGGFAEGATVHVGWSGIDVAAVDAGGSSGPLAQIDGGPAVRWSAGGGYMPLAAYLNDQLALMGQ